MLGIAQVVDEDLLGQRERVTEALAGRRPPVRASRAYTCSTSSIGVLAVVAMGHLTGLKFVAPATCAGGSSNTTIRQVRTIRYREIADDLRRRVEAGEFAAGRLLPSEAELSGAYSASRVTIRKALEELRDEGLIDARQGFGWFVADDTGAPVARPSGHASRSSSRSPARRSQRKILDFGFIKPPARVRQVLGVDKVLQVRRLNLADGRALRPRHGVVPGGARRATLSRAQVEQSSFYDLLAGRPRRRGADHRRGRREHARRRAPRDPEGIAGPACASGSRPTPPAMPVLLAESIFPGHLTEFIVDLPHPEASIAPSGLRLVE